MITIINTPSSMYEGMTIADAASQMVLEANNVIHEFEMDVLLSEHAYLYENACEVEYFVENKITDAGKNLVAKAHAAIEKVRKIIADLWNKLVDWVTTKVTEIKKKFLAAGVKEKSLRAVVADKDNDAVTKVVEAVEKSDNNWIFGISEDAFTTDGYISDIIDADKVYAVGEYFKKEQDAATEVRDFRIIFETAVSYVYADAKIINQIKKAQKAADAELLKMKKEFAQAFTKKEDPEAHSELMTAVKACLNNNTAVTRDKVKLYTTLTSESIKIVSMVSKIPAVRKAEQAKLRTSQSVFKGKVPKEYRED